MSEQLMIIERLVEGHNYPKVIKEKGNGSGHHQADDEDL
jgi:hypothetical protein